MWPLVALGSGVIALPLHICDVPWCDILFAHRHVAVHIVSVRRWSSYMSFSIIALHSDVHGDSGRVTNTSLYGAAGVAYLRNYILGAPVCPLMYRFVALAYYIVVRWVTPSVSVMIRLIMRVA